MISKSKKFTIIFVLLIAFALPITARAISESAYGSVSTDVMIYDNQTAYHGITISGAYWPSGAEIDSIRVRANIDHDYTGHLRIWLGTDSWNSKDDGSFYILYPSATGDDLWDGYGQTLDIDQTFSPSSSYFKSSQVANQTWYLVVEDISTPYQGRIDNWNITINYHYPVQPYLEVDNISVNTSSNSAHYVTGELRHSSGDPNGKTVKAEIIIPGESARYLGSDVTYSYLLNNGLFEIYFSAVDFYDLCEGSYTIHVWFEGDQDYYAADGYSTLSVNDDTPPNKPRNVDDGVSGYTNDTTPTFTWDPPSDKCGISRYRYSTTDSTPDSGEPYTYNEYITLSAQPEGLNYFYVSAEDYEGNIGPAEVHAFHIDVNPPPAPGNLTDGVTGWNNDTTPTFTWTMPSDVSGISGYYWAINDSSPQSGGTWIAGGGSTSVTLPVQSSGTKTFYVVAKDGAGSIGSVASHEFSIDGTTPSAPGTPDMYASDDTGYSSTDNITKDTSIRFDWGASSDSYSGLDGYYWAVGDSTPASGGTFTTNTYATGINPAEGNRVFYVQAVDNSGNLSSVRSLSFTVDRTAPAPPNFTWPSEWEVIHDTTPLLQWQSVSGAWKYQVFVREDALIPLDSRTSPELTTTYWQISSGDTLDYKDWGWQVKAWDIAGNEGSFGANGSNNAWGHFSLQLPFTVTGVTASVTPASVTNGETITQSGQVVGTGNGTVTYRWEHLEPGSSVWDWSGLEYTVAMTNGNATISPAVIDAPGTGGTHKFRIVVTSPDNAVSNEVSVTVEAVFGGTITDGQPRSFTGTIETDMVITVENTGNQITSFRVAPENIPAGWSIDNGSFLNNYIEILDLAPGGTATATFKVTAPNLNQSVNLTFGLKYDEPSLGWQDLSSTNIPVSCIPIPFTVTGVTASVTPGTVTSGETITQSGQVAGTGDGTVTYRWEHLDPGSSVWDWSGLEYTVSMTNGSATINPAVIDAPGIVGTHKFRIVVTSPDNVVSNEVSVVVEAFYGGMITDGQPRTFIGAVETAMLVTVENTGDEVTSYRAAPENIPAGWSVDNGSILNDYIEILDLAPGGTATASFKVTAPNLDQSVNLTFGLKFDEPTLGWQDMSSTNIPVSSIQDATAPTITSVEPQQDNLGHITIDATVFDQPSSTGLDPDTIIMYFDDVDDLWPTDWVRMDHVSGDQYTFTIPYGVIFEAGEFADQHEVQISIVAQDYAGNQFRYPAQGTLNVIVNNGTGQDSRLIVTDPGDNVVDIRFSPDPVDLGDGWLQTEIGVYNTRALYLELLPYLIHNSSEEVIPRSDSWADYSTGTSYIASWFNREVVGLVDPEAGDILSSLAIKTINWPPIWPDDQYINYSVETTLGDQVRFEIASRGGTLFVLDFAEPFIAAAGVPLNSQLSASTQEDFHNFMVVLHSIYGIVDEMPSIMENIENGRPDEAIRDLAQILVETHQYDLVEFLAGSYESSITSLVNQGFMSPVEGSQAAASVQGFAEKTAKFLHALHMLEAIINEAWRAVDFMRTPWEDSVTIEHISNIQVRDDLRFTVGKYSGFDAFTGESPRVLRWDLGQDAVIEVNYYNDGAQYLYNVWLVVELYEPPVMNPILSPNGDLLRVEVEQGRKIETIRTPYIDPALQDYGDFILDARVGPFLENQEPGSIVLPPADGANIRILNYVLDQTDHPLYPHTFYAGTYLMRYTLFADGPPGDQAGAPGHQVGDWVEVEVQIVDAENPDAPYSLVGASTDGIVVLDWAEPDLWEDANRQIPSNRDIAGYYIYRGTSAATLADTEPLSFIEFPAHMFLDESAFVSDQEYYYAVQSVDLKGSKSSLSNIVSVIPNPGQRTIQGFIYDLDGYPIEGVILDGFPSAVSTNSAGEYSAVVPYGWSGVVIPQKAGYQFIFLPTNEPFAEYNEVTGHMANQNYLGELQDLSISGYVLDAVGNPIEDVVVSASGNGVSITGSDGMYTLYVPYEWTGTVSPEKDGFSFSPPSTSFTSLTTDQTDQNFTGEGLSVTIDGYVLSSLGQGIENVLIDGLPTDVYTNSQGYFQTIVDFGWSGIIIPGKIDYTFDPSQKVINPVTDSISQNFTGYYCQTLSSPTNPSPADLVTDVPISQNLDWDDVPGAVRYDVYFGSINPPVLVGSTTTSSYALPELTNNVNYYWRIVAINECGGAFPGPVWSFTTTGGVTNGPEIQISGNTVEILNNDSTPSLDDHTNFGSVDIATETMQRTFTIRNLGDADLNLTGSPMIEITGTNATDFTVTVQPSGLINAGGFTTFIVNFDPSATGIRTATVMIANNDSDENPYSFAIEGNGTEITEPEMIIICNGQEVSDDDISPSSIDCTDFGSVDVVSGSISQTFTISNSGNADLDLPDDPIVVISGAGSTYFTVTSQPTSPVNPSGSTSFTIAFDPSEGGIHTATVSIANNDTNENPYNFTIEGEGTISTTGEISVKNDSNDTLVPDGDTTPTVAEGTDFGSVSLEGGTVTQWFRIWNTHPSEFLYLTGNPIVELSGCSDFTITTQPGDTSLSPGTNSIPFLVTFDPSNVGTCQAEVSIANSDADEDPYNFTIQGTGAASGEISVKNNSNGTLVPDGDTTPSAAEGTDFGSISIGSGSATQWFRIWNTNPSQFLYLTGDPIVELSGCSDFTITTQPGDTSISPGTNSVQFLVTFNPSTAGTCTAEINIANSDSDENPYNFTIQGTAAASGEISVKNNSNSVLVPDGDTTPSVDEGTDFGSVSFDGSSATQWFRIWNTNSTQYLYLIGNPIVELSGCTDFTITTQPGDTSISPGTNSVQFLVTYAPSSMGICQAEISIANSDGDENPYNFAIAGTGIPPQTQVTNNTGGDAGARISGDFVVWSSDTDGDNEIVLYQISTDTTTVLTDNTAEDTNPKIHEDYVVWQSDVDGDGEIYLYRISTATLTKVTDNSIVDHTPEVNDGYVVWSGYVGADEEVFVYSISSGTTSQITDNSDTTTDFHAQVDGDYVVWQGEQSGWDVFLLQLSTGEITNLTVDNSGTDGNPQISGDFVVYQSTQGVGLYDIFLYQISTGAKTQLSNTAGLHNTSPQIDGDFVTWWSADGEIYLYQISTTTFTQITSNGGIDKNPQIGGSFVVWQGDVDGENEIYLYPIDTGETLKLTDNDYADEYPYIDGNYIVWQGYDGDTEIFLMQISSPDPEDDFVITIKSDNTGTSTNLQFTIPTTGSGYNYNVDCNNDGTNEATALSGDYTCDYASAGTYTIRIKDNKGTGVGFPRIYFNDSGDKEKILSIVQWGTGKWTSMASAFKGCSNLTSSAVDDPNLMFVTDMSQMFYHAFSFNAGIGSWDTGNVTNMSGMFGGDFLTGHTFNQDISDWDTGNVNDMSSMFFGAREFNQDIGSWDTSNVTNMSNMFRDAYAFNGNIGSWNTGMVTNMSYMFSLAKVFNQDIGSWDTGKVTTMYYMFRDADAFDQNIGGWDVGALTNADIMFYGAKLSTENYDALLNGWNAQTLQPNVTFDAGNSTFCDGEAARSNMVDIDGWTITDGGRDCGPSFSDDFETGDLSLWSRVNLGGGFLTVCSEAAMNGSWGACVDRGTNDKRKLLIDDTPVDQTSFSVRFNMDINSFSMPEGTRFRFLEAKRGLPRTFFLVLRRLNGNYQLQFNILVDEQIKLKSAWYNLSDMPHTIEIDWQAASADGANDGYIQLYMDDSLLEEMTGLDNDTHIVSSLRIGFIGRLEGSPISGIWHVDDVATGNTGYIGLP